MNEKACNKGQQENNTIDNWHKAFMFFLSITFMFPLLLLALQLIFTWNEFIVDWSQINNWNSVTDMFGLPVGVFTALVALTTLIGMYHRSLQLTNQLDKVEQQLVIATDQLNLVQTQFELTYTKDNFVLYCEHRKQFIEQCESVLDGISQRPELRNIIIDYTKLYTLLFPENNTGQVQSFFMTTARSAGLCRKDIPKITECIGKINIELLINIENDSFQYKGSLFHEVATILGNVGVFIQNKHYLDEKAPFDSCEIFLETIYEVSILLSRVGLLIPDDVTNIYTLISSKIKEIEIYKLQLS